MAKALSPKMQALLDAIRSHGGARVFPPKWGSNGFVSLDCSSFDEGHAGCRHGQYRTAEALLTRGLLTVVSHFPTDATEPKDRGRGLNVIAALQPPREEEQR